MRTKKPTKKANFKGFMAFHREDKKRFTIDDRLNLNLLAAYYCFVSEADWQENPKRETYGCITKSDTELAKGWGLHPTTVTKLKHRLISKGFLCYNSEGYLMVKDFERFSISGALQVTKESNQPETEINQPVYEKNLNNQGQNSHQSFSVSSKGKFNNQLTEEDRKIIDNLKLEET